MRVELSDMDLEDMIGTDCYEAALGYVRRQAVGEHLWIPRQNALFGVVYGSYGEFYTPTGLRLAPGTDARGPGRPVDSCDARYAL